MSIRNGHNFTITYWILRAGKPFKGFPSRVARRRYVLKMAKNPRLSRRAYTFKTVVNFALDQ